MNKTFFLILITTFIFSSNIFVYSSQQHSDNDSNDDKYDSLWQTLQQADSKDQTRKSLDLSYEIFNEARKENNLTQTVKSILYILSYRTKLSDTTHCFTECSSSQIVKDTPDKYIDLIMANELSNLAKNCEPTLQSVIYYIVAGIYGTRCQRTRVADDADAEEPFESKLQYYKKTIDFYKLAASEHSKTVSINSVKSLFKTEQFYDTKSNDAITEQIPSLYDFYCFSMLEFAQLALPNRIKYSDPQFFADDKTFSKLKFNSVDPYLQVCNPIEVLSDLTRRHILLHNKNALAYANYTRAFILENYFESSEKATLQKKFYKRHIKKTKKNTSLYGLFADNYARLFLNDAFEFDNYHNRELQKSRLTAYNILRDGQKHSPKNSQGYNKVTNSLNDLTCQSFSFNLPENICSNENQIINVRYKNLDKMTFSVYADDEPTKPVNNVDTNKYLQKLIRQTKPVCVWTQNLVNDKLLNPETSEVVLKALPLGRYYIIATDEPIDTPETFDLNVSVKDGVFYYASVQVTNICMMKTHSQTTNYILDRQTGRPKSGAKVKLFEKHDNEQILIDEFTTDENGAFECDINKYDRKNRWYSLYYLVSHGEDQAIVSNIYNYNYGENSSDRLFVKFFTDRAVYRPGQTVKFKALVYNRNDMTLATNKQVEIICYDANYVEVVKKKLTTNDFGSICDEFVVPSDRLNGEFHLECVGLTGVKYFTVSEYKRPKFEVTFSENDAQYKLGDKITLVGTAKNYSGTALQNASVAYTVMLEKEFPWWARWAFSKDSVIMITDSVTETNSSGQFSVSFDTKNVITTDAINKFTVTATVTDDNGETNIGKTHICLSNVALNIDLDIPEIIYKHTDNVYKISATNLDDREVANSGSLKLTKLITPNVTFFKKNNKTHISKQLYTATEYKMLLPHYAFEDENDPKNFPKDKQSITLDYDTKKSTLVDFKQIDSLPSGLYELNILTADESGHKLNVKKYITIVDFDKNMPYEKDFFVNVDKKSAKIGEKVKIDIGSSKSASYLVLIEQGRKLISQNRYKVDGRTQIEYEIKPQDAGNITINIFSVLNNTNYNETFLVKVEYEDKLLNINIENIEKSVEPHSTQTLELTVTDKTGSPLKTELVATLFDSSLNAFRPLEWETSLADYYKYYFAESHIATRSFATTHSDSVKSFNREHYLYDHEETLRFDWQIYDRNAAFFRGPKNAKFSSRAMGRSDQIAEYTGKLEKEEYEEAPATIMADSEDLGVSREVQQSIRLRTDFAETAFFDGIIRSDDSGKAKITLTMPDTLTRWDLRLFAHSQSLQLAECSTNITTEKSLMVTTNIMRFVRNGDKATIQAKIDNVTDKPLDCKVRMKLFDGINGQQLDKIDLSEKNIKIEQKNHASVEWQFVVPNGINALRYEISAVSQNFSDAESNSIAVLPRKTLVTETLHLASRKPEQKTYRFDNFSEQSQHSARETQSLTVEYTANPIWTVMMSLPYLLDYQYDCMEQTFAKIYANAIGRHIVNENKEIRETLEKLSESKSPLNDNSELKAIMLQQTPWVYENQQIEEQLARLKYFADEGKTASLEKNLINKLKQGQNDDGGWSWFVDGPSNFFITLHICTQYGHLKRLNITIDNNEIGTLMENAVKFCDNEMLRYYQNILNQKVNIDDNHLTSTAIDYLYMRANFANLPLKDKTALDYFSEQAKKFWQDLTMVQRAELATAFKQSDETFSLTLIDSIEQNKIDSEEFGIYWKQIDQMPNNNAIRAQALLIETFQATKYEKNTSAMKIWLLGQKRTQNWPATTAASDAIYTLLNGTDNPLAKNDVSLKIGSQTLDINKEKIGYYKKTFNKDEILPEMNQIILTNKSENLSWGGVFWQYFEETDKIATTDDKAMRISKKYIVKSPSGKVKTQGNIKVGDIVTVRLEIAVDRNYEFVHIQDNRAGCLEPLNVLSGYKCEKICYYEDVKDSQVNFFAEYLPKGSYILQYDLRATASGEYLSGLATMQCMYAPEFTAHSTGECLVIEK